MYRLLRNTHLAIGLAFFLTAVLFVLSSVIIVYRSAFPSNREETATTVTLEANASPREAALELMRDHGLRGDLLNVKPDNPVSFRINRPGTHTNVEYFPETGEAKVSSRRYNFYETLVQLHVNHGFWHSFLPSNVWAFLSLAVSIGLILLGATGIYLWYRLGTDRVIGLTLLGAGVVVPVAALVFMRLQA